jgi:FixJ family two-component response regulator
MTETRRIVFVVDDDPSMRLAIQRLVRAVGLDVETFGSAQEFLERPLPDVPGCLILDVRMRDIPMSVKAMKAGAVEFLTKPFRDQDLLDAIGEAIQRDVAQRSRVAELAELREHHESLTPREHEVMALVVTGLLNKQIAAELGTSEKTVKIHRSHIMNKMRAESLAELARIAERLGITSQRPTRLRPKS